jgi:general secretion pathway protein B
MSYILDALQRANAERERGTVPGLHAQPRTAPEIRSDNPPRGKLWVLLLVACTAVALLAGWWFGRGSARPPVAEAAPVARVVAPPPALQLPATAVATATPAPPPSTAPLAAPAHVPQPATVQERVPTAPPNPPANPAPRASAPLPWLAELPEETRRQIATLAITGAVYSENPSQRLLLVNGQVLPQGSPVVPEVTLEEIREHHSVFSFRGTRFRLAH